MDKTATTDSAATFRYLQLADEMERKIAGGVYQAGEKLPSLRKLHGRTGCSITTVYQAYIELEKRGVVVPKQKSGFFVQPLLKDILPPPRKKRPPTMMPRKVAINRLIESLHTSLSDESTLQLGGALLSPELLPYKALFKSMQPATDRKLKRMMTIYEHPSGNRELRRQIAKRTIGQSTPTAPDEIIITNGCMEAISICLRAVAKAGDTILVESPTFHCFLQLIEDLDMFALELPVDPQEGMDPDDVKRAVDQNQIAACILIPNFQNPTGYSMSEERKKALVDFLGEKGIPIIEDNIYGDLYFGDTRPGSLKDYDTRGQVLYCSSFSKTLAPGLRVGWTIAGSYKETVKRIKINANIASPILNQTLVAEFLKSGSYERHLRNLRRRLQNQMSNTARAIAHYFPADTQITAPKGGLLLWAQLNPAVDTLDLYYRARAANIAILPGVLCATNDRYVNCLRIPCGNLWGDRLKKGIAQLGEMITAMV